MKVLVLNCGSSSIKYKLFDMEQKSVIAQGGIEKIGLKDSFLKFTLPSGEKKILEKEQLVLELHQQLKIMLLAKELNIQIV